jgi:hypothetical protein
MEQEGPELVTEPEGAVRGQPEGLHVEVGPGEQPAGADGCIDRDVAAGIPLEVRDDGEGDEARVSRSRKAGVTSTVAEPPSRVRKSGRRQ